MHHLDEAQLSELMAKVMGVNPHLADGWQATAIIESLGYTDRSIQAEFGFPDALALGNHVYEHYCSSSQPSNPSITLPQTSFKEEALIFLREFSKSFIFAVPLLVILLLEYLPLAKSPSQLPPELTSLLTLATITSLMTSGGFVQMISRQGGVYMQMQEPGMARAACWLLFKLGMGVSLFLSLLGLWFGFYRSLFADQCLIIASVYYLILCTLWMLFALLPIFVPSGALLFLMGLTAIVAILRLFLGISALVAQSIAVCITLGTISILIFIKLQLSKKSNAENSPASKLPKLSAVVYLLLPFFCYGVLYFGFIFADRIVAGSAINPATGLIFAIDSAYQKQLDLALLSFLLLVPLVEYLSYRFIRYWYQQSRTILITPVLMKRFSHRLSRRYSLSILMVLLLFIPISAGIFAVLYPRQETMVALLESFGGSLGYLLFSMGLFNAITLFSLNRVSQVLQSLVLGFVSNLVSGYLLSHLFGASYAVVGLILGASLFAFVSGRAIVQAINQPDYQYYIGGY